MTKQKLINTLATEIANYLNMVNHNTFTPQEVNETINEYVYMIENKDTSQLIAVLKDEIINTEEHFPQHAEIAKNFINDILNKIKYE